MNYIIDPAVFYWMGVSNAAKNASVAIFAMSVITVIITTVLFLIARSDSTTFSTDSYYYKNAVKTISICRKLFIASCIAMTLSLICIVFIPGKDTLTQMLIARTATFENVDWTVSQVKEIVDYIVNAIKGAV